MDVSQIKLQINMLEAQKAGLEEQIRRLKEIPCPICNGQGNITREEPDPNHTGAVIYHSDLCESCEGTGYACGEKSHRMATGSGVAE